ncbi:hypothetical protein C8Q80DRAFT_611917 [Daedaleopsis nitida]|nr:hypothetical protein C8Q80DRAFT_611917 [Daedaleopsis nitida]
MLNEEARVRMLCDEDQGVLSPGEDYANDDDLSSHASALLAQLRASVRRRTTSVDVEPFIKSDLANIWASHQFQGDVNGKWGDYGYITRNGATETFVPLGHIYDLIKPTGKITTFILRRGPGQDWRPAEEYPWSVDVVCHTFERAEDAKDCIEDIAVTSPHNMGLRYMTLCYTRKFSTTPEWSSTMTWTRLRAMSAEPTVMTETVLMSISMHKHVLVLIWCQSSRRSCISISSHSLAQTTLRRPGATGLWTRSPHRDHGRPLRFQV